MTTVYSLPIVSRERNHSRPGTCSSTRIKVVAKKSKIAPSSRIRNPYKRRIHNSPLCSSSRAQKTKAQKVVTSSPKRSSTKPTTTKKASQTLMELAGVCFQQSEIEEDDLDDSSRLLDDSLE